MDQTLQLRIIRLGDFYLPDLHQVAQSLSSSKYCSIKIEDKFLSIPDPDYKIGEFISEYSFEALAQRLDAYRQSDGVNSSECLIGVVNHSLQQNYFSMSRDDNSCVVASVSDIEHLLGSVSLREFLILEIAQCAVAAVEGHKWHSEPRRCLYDFCGDKRDIASSLRYKALCSSCEASLSVSARRFLSIAAQLANNRLVNTEMQKILFVSADPSGASRLKIQREHREIKHELQMSVGRECFVFDSHLAIRASDLSRALLQIPRPAILHFSGHGTEGAGEICLEDNAGKAQSVSGEAIAALLRPIASQLTCIVLNSCYSNAQASAILEHVPYVIGMTDAIGDDAAIAYSIGFYQAVFNRETIPVAHELGCAQIQLTMQNQKDIPKLHCATKESG